MKFCIESNTVDREQLPVDESLFMLGNGYLGVRGNFEEGYPEGYATIRGTYINGFYDDVPVTYAEKQFGDPETAQKMLNVMDAQGLTLYIGADWEAVTPFNGELLEYRRGLNLKAGFSWRTWHVRTPRGRELRITVRRLVSFEMKELLAVHYRIEPLNFSGPARLVSTINGAVQNYSADDDPRVASGHGKRLNLTTLLATETICMELETMASKLRCACASKVIAPESVFSESFVEESEGSWTGSWTLDEPIEFTKYTVFTDSIRHLEPLKNAECLLETVSSRSFESLLDYQKDYLAGFWSDSDVKIEGDENLQDGIRFNLFQMLQSIGKEPFSSMAAKGLSGEGYEGHYFWDTEIYVLPFFLMTQPELAKNLLLFRWRTLPQARERAKVLGHTKGTLYPWRTISGNECSGFFPAGTAQYHISGDIAYGFIQYWMVTGDVDFLLNHGAEVIFETARLWLDVGHYSEGRFCIDGVTGPDEYTAIVNNNYYTNTLARHNLRWAAEIFRLLNAEKSEAFRLLKDRLNLTDEEIVAFEHAADAMHLPYSEALDIHAQDDSFLNKAPWDFANTPKDERPLLLRYHPLTLYRHQVCKQADVVLSHFMMEDGVAESTLSNSYAYYEKITTFDSSLTACIYSIMASRLGMPEKAWQYFAETVRLDLDNTHHNTRDGLHIANMGGTWLSLVFGFAGLRIHAEGLSFSPALPKHWSSMAFSLKWRGSRLSVAMEPGFVRFSVEGAPIEITVFQDICHLEPGTEVVMPLKTPETPGAER